MKNITTKVIATITYIAMVFVNFLANSLPINGRSTGVISDSYPNIFAPAGPAFSIWGVIYLLLGAYIVYQFVKKDEREEALLAKINPLFIATSVANIMWIFAWHYDYIGLSVLIMAVLLILLIKIADILRVEQFSASEKLLIRAPFSVYFGWITVATIANVTVFLVSIDWNGFGLSESLLMGIVLLVGATIGILRMNKDSNIPYGIVLVWAYAWILSKHLSSSGFDGQYPAVIITTIVCIALFLIFIGKQALRK